MREYRVLANGLRFKVECRHRQRFLYWSWWSEWWTPETYVLGLPGRRNYFDTLGEALAQVDQWRQMDVAEANGWQQVWPCS